MAPQWTLLQPEPGTPVMALRDRVRQLRTEAGWSQTHLAERIAADPAQISRYETGKITPSADAIVRLAETFGVSCDYLLIDDAPRRPFKSPEDTLGEHLHQLTELTPDDQQLVISFIDALVTKTRLKTLASGIT
jgi:transcriptional regulator with XRE-family HTH domain